MSDTSPGKVQALRAIFSEQNQPVMGLMPPKGPRPWSRTEQQPLREKQRPGEDPARPNRTSAAEKPAIGPKPARLLAQKNAAAPPPEKETQPLPRGGVGDTIATFMFSGSSDKENDRVPPPLPKPRHRPPEEGLCRSSLISSDNYICKGNGVKRKPVPPADKLGPPPLKPNRPPHLRLPGAPRKPAPLQRPPYPCPPRPATPPPLPPVIKPPTLREEIEELYEDTLLGEQRRPVSLIPEYTEEEEQAELYNDAAGYDSNQRTAPSEYLQPNNALSNSHEELYQDADGVESDEVYEVMPCDEIPDDASGSPLYSNNKKEIEKLRKEEEKRVRKEQRERDKRQKELDKLRKKFGLTGEEIPIDDGLVKWDSRGGGKGDLPVRRGETVLILRMEGNPQGRWLVKNEKGKIGYVELTNIEVDPLSVKSASTLPTEDNQCTTPLEKNVTWLSKITACVR